jgi:predicted Fe-Mo cluster-binding NifX family protein
MYIAVAAEGKSLRSKVSNEFSSCKYLLIVNMDSMEIDAVANSGDLKGKYLASKAVANNCEAVITGKLTPEAFDIIADDDITRYDGRGYIVQDALSRMDRNALKLIRNVEGTDECESKHTENSCDGHHE